MRFGNNNQKVVFALLLIYSLLPGIVKLFDIKEIFLLNVPILIYLAFDARVNIYPVVIISAAYIAFSLLQSIIMMAFGASEVASTLTSFYMYLLPFVGIISLRRFDVIDMFKLVAWIAFIHALIGIFIFGFIELPSWLGEVSARLREGVFPFRMASVSGSIGFGILCTMGLICSTYLARRPQGSFFMVISLILFFSIILSQQRSAWIVAILFLVWHFSQSIFKNLPFLILILVTASILILNLQSIDPEIGNFFIDRVTSSIGADGDSNIVSERSHMWATSFNNFISNPIGLGLGQGGYIAQTLGVNLNIVVTDGDYFRIMQESGMAGLLYYISIIFLITKSFLTEKNTEFKYLLWIPISSLIQMIGSNLTEFYFTNYMFWIFIGAALNKPQKLREFLSAMGDRSKSIFTQSKMMKSIKDSPLHDEYCGSFKDGR